MKNAILAAAFCVISSAISTSAATVLSVTGSGGGLGLGQTFDAGGAVQTFDVTQDVFNASIGIDLALCSGNCEGRVSLYSSAPGVNGIPGGASASLVSDLRFCGTARDGCDALTGALPRTVFSDLTLAAGTTYSIAVGVTSGGAIWFGSANEANRTVSVEGGALVGEAFSIPTLFDSIFLLNNPVSSIAPSGLNFVIEGDTSISQVPLPAGFLLFGTALMGLWSRRRRI